MSPMFYALAGVMFVVVICLAIVEFRIRRLANEARKIRIEIAKDKRERFRVIRLESLGEHRMSNNSFDTFDRIISTPKKENSVSQMRHRPKCYRLHDASTECPSHRSNTHYSNSRNP